VSQPGQHWIVTADGRGACLYSCQRTPGGALHLERLRAIENAHFHDHERGRPTLVGGAERAGGNRSGAAAAPHSVAVNHEPEEEQRRFARDVRGFLSEAARAGAGTINVFAPPAFLGVLRKEIGKDAPAERLALREGELAGLRAAELSVHPAVLRAVGDGPGTGR
jgi:protein required for attachment to host cells